MLLINLFVIFCSVLYQFSIVSNTVCYISAYIDLFYNISLQNIVFVLVCYWMPHLFIQKPLPVMKGVVLYNCFYKTITDFDLNSIQELISQKQNYMFWN